MDVLQNTRKHSVEQKAFQHSIDWILYCILETRKGVRKNSQGLSPTEEVIAEMSIYLKIRTHYQVIALALARCMSKKQCSTLAVGEPHQLITVGPSFQYFGMIHCSSLVGQGNLTGRSRLLVASIKWPCEQTKVIAANFASHCHTIAILLSWLI